MLEPIAGSEEERLGGMGGEQGTTCSTRQTTSQWLASGAVRQGKRQAQMFERIWLREAGLQAETRRRDDPLIGSGLRGTGRALGVKPGCRVHVAGWA